MENNRKKYYITGVILALLLCSAAIFLAVRNRAGGRESGVEVIPDRWPAWAATDDGVYYRYMSSNGDVFLRYIDYATSTDVAVCNKPNCQHDSDTCNAYYGTNNNEEGITGIFYYNDLLYLWCRTGTLDASGFVSTALYVQNMDGTGRTELFEMDCEPMQAEAVSGDTLYFLTATLQKEYKEKYKDVSYEDADDDLYDELNKHQVFNLWRYEFDTGNLTCVEEELGGTADSALIGMIPSTDSEAFYIWHASYEGNATNTSIYAYNVTDDTYEEVFAGLTESAVTPSIFYSAYIYESNFYFVGEEAEEKGFYCYNIKTEQLDKLASFVGSFETTDIQNGRIIFNLGYGEENSSYAREYRRIVYFDLDAACFYVAEDGPNAPKYSSGKTGIVDYTDYYGVDMLDEEIETYDYVVSDMEEYYEENFVKYSGQYPDVLVLE